MVVDDDKIKYTNYDKSFGLINKRTKKYVTPK